MQVDVGVALHEVEQPLQLRRIQVGRRATAQRETHEAVFAQGIGGHPQLLLHLRQIGFYLRRRGARHREQIAETAAVAAERHMQVQEQCITRLTRPGIGKRRRLGDRPVRGFVRIRVRIGLVRLELQQLGQSMGGHGLNTKCA